MRAQAPDSGGKYPGESSSRPQGGSSLVQVLGEPVPGISHVSPINAFWAYTSHHNYSAVINKGK